MPLAAPQLLAVQHQIAGFDSGVPSLDDWLQRRARANQVSGASRTFVTCDGAKVVGYYALGTDGAAGRFRRNMPDPIPVVVLGRLALDRVYQGRGPGRALFRDAAQRMAYARMRSASTGSLFTPFPNRPRRSFWRLA